MGGEAQRRGGDRLDVDDEDERRRARLYAARREGGLCAGCGRALAADEPVWWALFPLRGAYGYLAYQSGPVGRECAAPEVLRETQGREPEPCAGCGRGVYYQSAHALRRVATCSKRCATRDQRLRAKEARGS